MCFLEFLVNNPNFNQTSNFLTGNLNFGQQLIFLLKFEILNNNRNFNNKSKFCQISHFTTAILNSCSYYVPYNENNHSMALNSDLGGALCRKIRLEWLEISIQNLYYKCHYFFVLLLDI